MRAYQFAGLLLVCSAVTFVAGVKVGEHRQKIACATRAEASDSGACCGPVPGLRPSKEAPRIPTDSGLPCLLVFGSGTCEQCKQADALLADMAPRLKGHVDVIHLDPDECRTATAKWRVRIIPTQIVIDADGKEVERIEQFVPEPELIAALAKAGVKVASAPKTADG